MVILDYLPLDLQISKTPESIPNHYHAAILENGEITATHDFELRRDLKLSQMLESIEKKATTLKSQPEETTHIEFGKMLYLTVFSGELGEYFNKRFSESHDNNYGLRISLRFAADVPEIEALPWEYLYNGDGFLVTKKSILLSRLPLEVKVNELKTLNSTLRMLVVISSPEDQGIAPYNEEKEQEVLLEALNNLQKERKIRIDFTEDGIFENFQNYLNEGEYHIVHFIGHGTYIEGKGYLLFETEERRTRLVDYNALSDLFSHTGIRLVVLSSCQSAKSSNRKAFADLTSMLSRQGIPAVVGMQYSVSDEVAIQFAHTFYKSISSRQPVDVALNEARIMMKNSEKSNGFDFATPVLYLSDCNCVQVGIIKPEPAEFEFKPI